MAVNTEWRVGSDGNFNTLLNAAAGDRLAFSGRSDGISPISVDAWNPATIVANSTFDTFIAAARNCRYVSPNQIQLREDGVDRTLDEVGVTIADATAKITWQDTTKNTVLSNCKFYAYNGSNPITAPSGVTVVAFERTATAVNKNRISGDVTGRAWNADYGVGGSGAALALSDQASASLHTFYLGISARPTTYGSNTAIKFRVEFDVS